MKSHFPKVNYIELPLNVFASMFPDFNLPAFLDINDNDYIVRYGDVDGHTLIEFGYSSDEWYYFK